MLEWRLGKSLVMTSTTRSAGGISHVVTGSLGRSLNDYVDDPQRLRGYGNTKTSNR
jgi:hypothetical protein